MSSVVERKHISYTTRKKKHKTTNECRRFGERFTSCTLNSTAAGTAQSVWRRAGQPRNRGSILGRYKRCFFSSVQTSTGAHPASYPMVPGGSFPKVKRPGRDTTQLHLVLGLQIRGALPPLQCRTFSLISTGTTLLSNVTSSLW
jgi:hypothetical protein